MSYASKTLAASLLCAAAATSRITFAEAPVAPPLAPEFTHLDKWLNSQPLTLHALRGKVVLIDFWTYTCINCIHTLPYVERWHEQYKDQGLVVIGVHTPEYPFERSTENVEAAIRRFGLRYPVAQDNDYATWNAYQNRYWPAFYLVDKRGHVVYRHFGEGSYAETEAQIQRALGKNPTSSN
ncbi:thioredoxin family protein [Trinickia sp. LjRoot230]|uniref:thioredoxin family protein n=1 Tax=Trinickia sp. LjRoot230 TaxID=3342288 RepID=UPI003ECC452A